jgi:hypothetical protein
MCKLPCNGNLVPLLIGYQKAIKLGTFFLNIIWSIGKRYYQQKCDPRRRYSTPLGNSAIGKSNCLARLLERQILRVKSSDAVMSISGSLFNKKKREIIEWIQNCFKKINACYLGLKATELTTS